MEHLYNMCALLLLGGELINPQLALFYLSTLRYQFFSQFPRFSSFAASSHMLRFLRHGRRQLAMQHIHLPTP